MYSMPCSSPAIAGRAVATMVWSIAPRNMPHIVPLSISRISRCVKRIGAGAVAVSGITGFLEGFAKINEGSREALDSNSQDVEFPGKKFVASDPQSQIM